MKELTQEGRQKVDDIAGQYNLRPETVESLLNAVVRGNGTMAQFNHAELGGQGQWMKGGMTMVGDMFNSSLRATVDKLCNDLSALVALTGAPVCPVWIVGRTRRCTPHTWPRRARPSVGDPFVAAPFAWLAGCV